MKLIIYKIIGLLIILIICINCQESKKGKTKETHEKKTRYLLMMEADESIEFFGKYSQKDIFEFLYPYDKLSNEYSDTVYILDLQFIASPAKPEKPNLDTMLLVLVTTKSIDEYDDFEDVNPEMIVLKMINDNLSIISHKIISKDDFIPEKTALLEEDIPISETDSLIITIDRTGLYDNIYKETLEIISNNGDVIINVYLNGLMDIDSNYYKIVTIETELETQTWMAENLKSTHYSDGTAISGVYAYDDDENNVYIYGRLYTWDAIMNGISSSSTNPSEIQGVCPDGWHVPSDAEWTELTNYLGGTDVAGCIMKETDTIHWNSPNTGATNESRFSALPGGGRYRDGNYGGIGDGGYFWSATESSSRYAWRRRFGYGSANVSRGGSGKGNSFSVRCVRD